MKKRLYDSNGLSVGWYYEEVGDIYVDADIYCQAVAGCDFAEAYRRMKEGEWQGAPFVRALQGWQDLIDAAEHNKAAYTFDEDIGCNET